MVPYPRAVISDVLPHPDHPPLLLLRPDDPDYQEGQQQQHPEVRLQGLKQEGRVQAPRPQEADHQDAG